MIGSKGTGCLPQQPRGLCVEPAAYSALRGQKFLWSCRDGVGFVYTFWRFVGCATVCVTVCGVFAAHRLAWACVFCVPEPGTPLLLASCDLAQCVHEGGTLSTDSVFGSAYVISLGFLVVLCVTIPIGFFNLEENM